MSDTRFDALWPSLPVPALMIDDGDKIAEVNSSSELFLNASARSLTGVPVFDKLAIDAPLEEAFSRVRRDNSPMFINNVDVSGGNAAPVQCNIQISPLQGMENWLILMMEPRQIADRLGRSHQVKTSARSAIGMSTTPAKSFSRCVFQTRLTAMFK